MAKHKKKKSVLSYIKYGAVLFALAGVCMTALAFVTKGELGFSGLQVIFGYTENGLMISVNQLGFSFMALLTVLLPIIGCFSVLFNNTLVRIVGTLFMFVGTILCFFMPAFVNYANIATQTIMNGAGLGIGAILMGIFFGVGTACNFYSIIEKDVY